MAAGYSGTPLIKKLGIKEESQVFLVGEPTNYFELLETDISGQICSRIEEADVIHVFVKTQKEFEAVMKKIRSRIKDTAMIWVSWYKKSAGIKQILQKMLSGIMHYNMTW